MGCAELINDRKGMKEMKKRFWKDRIKKAVKILTGADGIIMEPTAIHRRERILLRSAC